MAHIACRQLYKTYDQKTAVLQPFDLDIADGEFIVLLGPSGCGKSTLLRMIAGLEDISAGQLRIGELLANDLPPAERGIAMVFQSYALYPHMTARDNMGFALKMAGRPDAEVRAAVGKVAEILQITHLLERKPKALSGGERQRVAIGRAIVRQPKVFLFDEPLSNLDASLRVQTRIELARLHQELGTTMIYVTHDQVEAMTLGDRVAVFHGGHLEQVGPPLTLYRQPASQFVAGFIGALRMNFLPCSAVPQLAAQLGGEAGMLVGIRPEHLRLTPRGEGHGATVTLIEQLGDAQIIHAMLDNSTHALAIKLHGETRHALVAGSAIGFAPEEGHAFLFDAAGRAVSRH